MNPRLLRPTSSTLDKDAAVYLNAVAAADQQQLEPAVRKAINDFVIGCKRDGIWDAIKASCILMGARTLSGALTPLKGGAPTNFNNNFVSGDYNRETGLVGDGSTKFLDTNYNGNTPPQDSLSFGVYVDTASSAAASYMGSGLATGGASNFGVFQVSSFLNRNRNATSDNITTTNISQSTGFIGSSRASSSEFTLRIAGGNNVSARASATPVNATFHVFKTNGSTSHINGRLSFFWAGESLNLALLDARVSALVTAIGAAI